MPAQPKHLPYSATRKQLFILGLFPLSEAIAWTTVFPYIYSMVHSISSSEPGQDNSALYAGIMVSVFTFGEFIMAPVWAWISDKIGRKPTLLIGSMGAMFSATLFGFSMSLPWAIVARTCAGLLNPNLGVVQTFVGELVGKEEQAKGFSVVPFLRSFGTIIGPVIGGYLAEPVKHYPSIFHENTIWDHYPYLLPNLIVVVFLFASSMTGLFFLEEVHPKFQDREELFKLLYKAASNILHGRPWNSQSTSYTAVQADEYIEMLQSPPTILHSSESQERQVPSAWTNQVVFQITSNAILGFMKIATLAIFPVFLATPLLPESSSLSMSSTLATKRNILSIKGGFGLDTTSTSNVLLSQAIATIIYQILVIPFIIAKIGTLHSYKMILIVLTLLFLLMPFSAKLPNGLGMPAILIALWIYALANGLATTCSAILITNTAPDPVHLAKINGASASFGCLARTLGPAVVGPLFGLGLKIGQIGIPFWSLSAVMGLGVIMSLFLSDHA